MKSHIVSSTISNFVTDCRIFKSSDVALAKCSPEIIGRMGIPVIKTYDILFPFHNLKIGESFQVLCPHWPECEPKLHSIKIRCKKAGRVLGRTFIVIVHDELNVPCVEIARIE